MGYFQASSPVSSPFPATFISVHSDSQKDAKLRVIPPITSGSLEKRGLSHGKRIATTGASEMGPIFDVGTLFVICVCCIGGDICRYVYIYI